MALEALERENPDAETAKTSSKEAKSSTSMWSSSTSGTPASKMSMASERSTDGEKNRCPERSPSSGCAW